MPTVSDIMTPQVTTIDADATVVDAVALLVMQDMSGVPVMQDQTIVGVVTELDLFDVLFDPNLRSRSVGDLMHTDVHTVDASEDLPQLAHMFALYGCRRLPVLRDGRLVGLVSRRDLLRFALNNDERLHKSLVASMVAVDEEC